MASLYKRKRSKFWWIKYRASDGSIRQESTGYCIGVGRDTRRAQELRARRTLDEATYTPSSKREHWALWVDDHLATRYSDSPNTLLRMRGAWRNLSMFLEEQSIVIPRQLTREHCLDFIKWRQRPNRSEGKYRAGHNTSHLELKVLGIVMAEAVLRGYAPFNPCRDLHIKRLAQATLRPALTPDVVALIRKKIALEPEPKRTFLSRSFEIAYHHGVRLSETFFNPCERVEFITSDSAKITFSMKGGRVHTVMLHPNLVPLFRALKEQQAQRTYDPPKSPSKTWSVFMKTSGAKRMLPGICFHSTRVNAATVLARAGISEAKAMRYIGHASTTVHRTYVRFRPEDTAECSGAIS